VLASPSVRGLACRCGSTAARQHGSLAGSTAARQHGGRFVPESLPALEKFPDIGTNFKELSSNPGPLMNINKFRKSGIVVSTLSLCHTIMEEEVSKLATRSEKSTYRYSDFYCFMSLADFTEYVSRDDADGEHGFAISRREPVR
jgi:hypothetical protein